MMIEKISIYDQFTCIADKCPMTCCQQWKISVDENTLEDWKKVPAKECIDEDALEQGKTLAEFVTDKDDTKVIRLNQKKVCPFLNHDKLCRLVMNYGDEMLSETCQIFPRQNSVYEDRSVYAVMSGCPVVVDLLRQQDDIIVATEKEHDGATGFFSVRNMMMQLIRQERFTLEEALQIGFLILLEGYGAQQKEPDLEIESVLQPYMEQEQQDIILDSIRKMDFDMVDTFAECNELFLDMVENYRKEGIYEDYLIPAAELAEEYEEAPEYEIEEDVLAFAEEYQKYDKLLRHYLIAEVFANLYLPEFTLESIVMAFQWIAMEYAAIRHMIFLQWVLSREDEISYEIVRDAIVIISRMTGYNEEDIREYLVNSFESPIWEWGYLALITGQ